MSSDADNGSIGFFGTFDHAVDASFRIMFPGVWRPVEKDTVFAVLPWPLLKRQYLIVLPPKRRTLLIERLLGDSSLVNEKRARIERALSGEIGMAKLDKVGRICLGERMAARVGIARQAKLVGRLDKFEIWDPARFDDYQERMETTDPITDEELEKLML